MDETHLKVKTGNNNLVLHFSSNMTVMFVSCQPVHQICQMCDRTVDFCRIRARKSILKAKIKLLKESVFDWLVNLFILRFLCLIVRP